MSLAARSVLVLLAAAAALWLAAGLRAAREESRAIALVRADAGPGELARSASLLRSAAAHSPSTRPELRLAQLLALEGRPAAARPVLEAIVRREPENADAWRLLALVTARADPPRAAAARARALALSPPQRSR